MIPIKSKKSPALTWINAAQIRKFIINTETHKACVIWVDGKTEYFSGDEAKQLAEALNICPGLNKAD